MWVAGYDAAAAADTEASIYAHYTSWAGQAAAVAAAVPGVVHGQGTVCSAGSCCWRRRHQSRSITFDYEIFTLLFDFKLTHFTKFTLLKN